ncbi:hypothetical protein [Desulfitibacter alkalitolerans]|uniref:hypothetical protein n=1 Tax=Desulfitibacter alkalitolerans TaxID=264641 RepID=UPI001A9A3B00|nr:hypothetical protein [Desulfitibacter alkalitolerans]
MVSIYSPFCRKLTITTINRLLFLEPAVALIPTFFTQGKVSWITNAAREMNELLSHGTTLDSKMLMAINNKSWAAVFRRIEDIFQKLELL